MKSTTVKTDNTQTTLAKELEVDNALKTLGWIHILKKKSDTPLEIMEGGMAYRGSNDSIVYDKIVSGTKEGSEVFVVSAAYKTEKQSLAVHVNTQKWKHSNTARTTLSMALPFQNSSTAGRISCHINVGAMATALSDHSSKFQEMAQTLMWDNFLRLTIGITGSMVDRGQLDKAVIFSPQEHIKRYRVDMLKLKK